MWNRKHFSSPKLQNYIHQRWRQSLKYPSNCIRTKTFKKLKYSLNASWKYSLHSTEFKCQQANSVVSALLVNIVSPLWAIRRTISLFNLVPRKSVIISTGFLVVAFQVSVNWNLKRKERREKNQKNHRSKKRVKINQKKREHIEKTVQGGKQLHENLKLVCQKTSKLNKQK